MPLKYLEGYKDINGNYRSINIDIWNYIEKRLDKKYKFKKIFIEETDLKIEDYIDQLSEDKYDLLIGPWFINYERYLKVDFSIPYLKKKILIVYSPEVFYRINPILYSKYIAKIWIKPIIFIIILSLICSFLLYQTTKKSVKDIFYNVTSGFFGQTSGFIKQLRGEKISSNLLSCFVIIIIFVTYSYIQVFSSAKSVKYLYLSNIFDTSIKGLKIYTTNNFEYKLLKSKGAKPILINLKKNQNIHEYYIHNGKNNGVAGFISDKDTQFDNFIRNNSIKFKISEVPIGYKNIAIPINKKNYELKEDINKEIIKFNNLHETDNVCQHYLPKKNSYIC